MIASLLSHTFPDAQLGGLVLTSSIPWARAIKQLMAPVQKKLPILGFNSREDKVLPFATAEERFAMLKDFGCNAEHHVVTDATGVTFYHDAMTEQMKKPFLQFVFRETSVEAPKEEIKAPESQQEEAKPVEEPKEEAKPAEACEQEAKVVEAPTEAKPVEEPKEEDKPE